VAAVSEDPLLPATQYAITEATERYREVVGAVAHGVCAARGDCVVTPRDVELAVDTITTNAADDAQHALVAFGGIVAGLGCGGTVALMSGSSSGPLVATTAAALAIGPSLVAYGVGRARRRVVNQSTRRPKSGLSV